MFRPPRARTHIVHTKIKILGTVCSMLTLEVDEPHNRAQGLLSNIYPIKMGDSAEFVRAMHIVEVDLRPYNATERKGRA
jgi:hypothetical protein